MMIRATGTTSRRLDRHVSASTTTWRYGTITLTLCRGPQGNRDHGRGASNRLAFPKAAAKRARARGLITPGQARRNFWSAPRSEPRGSHGLKPIEKSMAGRQPSVRIHLYIVGPARVPQPRLPTPAVSRDGTLMCRNDASRTVRSRLPALGAVQACVKRGRAILPFLDPRPEPSDSIRDYRRGAPCSKSRRGRGDKRNVIMSMRHTTDPRPGLTQPFRFRRSPNAASCRCAH